MSEGAPECVFLFETTHLAMWAEDLARESGIPAEVISAPPEAKAKCGLALRSSGDHCEALEAAMGAAGVDYDTYRR